MDHIPFKRPVQQRAILDLYWASPQSGQAEATCEIQLLILGRRIVDPLEIHLDLMIIYNVYMYINIYTVYIRICMCVRALYKYIYI